MPLLELEATGKLTPSHTSPNPIDWTVSAESVRKLLRSRQHAYRLQAFRLIDSGLKQAGFSNSDIYTAWNCSMTQREEMAPLPRTGSFADNFSQICKLETIKNGLSQALTAGFNIRNFYRYPLPILLDQYKKTG